MQYKHFNFLRECYLCTVLKSLKKIQKCLRINENNFFKSKLFQLQLQGFSSFISFYHNDNEDHWRLIVSFYLLTLLNNYINTLTFINI